MFKPKFRTLLFFLCILTSLLSAQTFIKVSGNKSATASSSESSSLSPSKAVDGNMTTRWSSNFYNNQWYKLDLGKSYPIEKIVLIWEAAYGNSYKIHGSNDNSTWTQLKSTSNSNGGIDTYTDSYGSYRYINIELISRATQYGFSLYEFEVYTVEAPERGITVSWLGELDQYPDAPVEGEAFHHSSEGQSFVFKNGSWETFALGETGATGPKGEQGELGLPGTKGDTGDQGLPGAIGNTGARGEQGPMGHMGPQGQAGINGTNGANGTDGHNGTDGLGIEWLGAFTQQPLNPTKNQAFYWIGSGISCLYDGDSWELMTRDGGVNTTHCLQLYTTTFDPNGGTGNTPSQSEPAHVSTNLISNEFQKNGHIFLGWSTSPGGVVTYLDNERIIWPSSPTTLYAVWEAAFVTSIEISITHFSMIMGRDMMTLTATALPTDAPNKEIIWSSNNPLVATINQQGVVTATGPGEAIITATAADGGGASASAIASVSQFRDTRGFGRTYDMTRIGSQVWMSENLVYDSPTGSSVCAPDVDCEEFGRYYYISGALNGDFPSNTNPSTTQGACPDNWHLPSKLEWQELYTTVGNSTLPLKSTDLWLDNTGNNESSLNLTPYGMYHGRGGHLYDNRGAYFLTSNHSLNHYVGISSANNEMTFNDWSPVAEAFSIRCVKN
ncbi:MAG: discoidin domain-containing protein [Fibrobacterales bacterium]